MILHAVHRAGLRSDLPWIVWLHGFLGNHNEWTEISSAFASWPQLFIDLPGHGGSENIPGNDFSTVDQLLRATLAHYNILNYWIIGYSLGARLAMFHACQSTNSGLSGLIVEGGHPGLSDDTERNARKQHDLYWSSRFRHDDFRQVLQDWYLQPVFATISESQREEWIETRSKNNPLMLADMLESVSLACQPDLQAALSKLTIPFYYLCGERDTKFRTVCASLGITPALIPLAGHNVHRENPSAFCTSLSTLLRNYDVKDPS